MTSGVFGQVISISVDLRNETIHGVPSVKKLPHVDAGGVQAKSTTGVGIEENRPVVKLLPEYDARVGYGFFGVLHGTDTEFLRPQQHSCREGHDRRRFALMEQFSLPFAIL